MGTELLNMLRLFPSSSPPKGPLGYCHFISGTDNADLQVPALFAEP